MRMEEEENTGGSIGAEKKISRRWLNTCEGHTGQRIFWGTLHESEIFAFSMASILHRTFLPAHM